jgi:predicted O-methyltransferase YrrM
MTITQELMALDPTLRKYNEGNWMADFSEDRAKMPGIDGFSSFNDAGVECETGEFLYSLVRLLKPENVLETGTHWGIGASYMGMGLKHNGRGHLDTVEFLPEIHSRAMLRIATLKLIAFVTCHLMDVALFDPKSYLMAGNYGPMERNRLYQLILLDTEPQTRFQELIKFERYLEPGGFIFIHDLNRHMAQVDEVHPDHPETPYWPWGPIPAGMKALVTSGQLRPFHFSTPRGLTGFYKPHPGDYVWGA